VAPARLREAPRTLFRALRRFRERRLRKAAAAFLSHPSARRELDQALEREREWLPDYALFRALKRAHAGQPWTEWPRELAQRSPAALERARKDLAPELDFEVFVQREFLRQWSALHDHASALGVRLLGDIPMFVAHDAADVWANQNLFQLHPDGRKRAVAGVPPDYFSAEGQLWGNPVYDWTRLRETGYAWWIGRLRATLERFDAARLDHFIGFHRYWEVPAGATSARDGQFVEAPGHDFFEHLRRALGRLPFVAEDLGVLTDGVVRLRDDFELPGMRILSFAFAGDWREYQPHRFPRRVVAYTGTHDNDTLRGWLDSHARETDARRAGELRAERDRALAYAGSHGDEPHWDLVRTLLASVADTTIFPIQDLLGLGTEARMNVPGVGSGNWTFRVREAALTPALAERLATLTTTYERTIGPRRTP
jgi:4-alpha-glucanotransferase